MQINRLSTLRSIFGDCLSGIPAHIKNEDRIAAELHLKLCELFLTNKINGIWFHVANEGVFNKQNFRPVYGAKLKKMGKAKGIFDYIFLWEDGCAMIELKYGKNKLSAEQKVIMEWADDAGIKSAVAYSCDDAINFLKKINFIKDN